LSVVCIPVGGKLKVVAGKRHLNLTVQDLVAYTSERAKRGALLPKGFQKVTGMEVIV